jgi:hypothetical protein
MEHTQSSELFSLSIDPATKAHLAEAAKWAKFLAIVGMVFLALLIIFGFFGAAILFSTASNFGGPEYGSMRGMSGFASTFFAVYIVIAAIIWFFPLLYTLRFASQMKIALAGNDQQALNKSFQNLKICLRFLGIVTIIILAIYAIVIVFAIVGASMFS